MRETTYECKRCGQVFNQLSHYKVHMKRKKLCGRANPADPESDVIPTLNNVKIVKIKASKCEGFVNIKLENSNHNTIKVDNSSHVHNHVHHTINLVSFGEEDRSLLQGLLQSNGSQN